MRGTYRTAAALLAALTLATQPPACLAQAPWQPSPGHTQIPIWPGPSPARSAAQRPRNAGTVVDRSAMPSPSAASPGSTSTDVSRPTMTVYSPAGKNTGAAVVVFPGGGYNVLAIDLEGTEVCDWLTSQGITCVLLKYRVPSRST